MSCIETQDGSASVPSELERTSSEILHNFRFRTAATKTSANILTKKKYEGLLPGLTVSLRSLADNVLKGARALWRPI